MTVRVYELDLYGAERTLEFTVRGGSLFVEWDGRCIELCKIEFATLIAEEHSEGSTGSIDLTGVAG
jgi:hypothetical protein